jgi:hypothetical protein
LTRRVGATGTSFEARQVLASRRVGGIDAQRPLELDRRLIQPSFGGQYPAGHEARCRIRGRERKHRFDLDPGLGRISTIEERLGQQTPRRRISGIEVHGMPPGRRCLLVGAGPRQCQTQPRPRACVGDVVPQVRAVMDNGVFDPLLPEQQPSASDAWSLTSDAGPESAASGHRSTQ